MKADNSFETTGHNRTIRVSEIPDQNVPTLTIVVNYANIAGEGFVTDKAVVLDGIIIPAIVNALNGKTNDEQLLTLAQAIYNASQDTREALAHAIMNAEPDAIAGHLSSIQAKGQ